MGGLRGSLIKAMADISKVIAEDKALAEAEKVTLSADYDSISRKCDMLKSVFPNGYEEIKKRYSSINWFSDPTILKSRLSKSEASMATIEVKRLHPEMLEFEARRLMQAECGTFVNGVFVFDLERAKKYLSEANEIVNEPDLIIGKDSSLKGNLVERSRKRINWRKSEDLAVKRMLEELESQRKKRNEKKPPVDAVETKDKAETISSPTRAKKDSLVLTPVSLPTKKAEKEVDKFSIKESKDIDFKPNTEEVLHLLRKNDIRYLYHFTSLKNIPSIKKNGGLFSWDYMDRNGITIPVPGGDSMSRKLDVKYNLQNYVRLSFCKDHPMAHRLRVAGEKIVLLIIDIRVAAFLHAQYSNMNAADSRHHHGPNISDLEKVDFDAVKRTYVSSSEPDFKTHQAEVMVKTAVPAEYILNLDDF